MGAPHPLGRRQAGSLPHVARVVPEVVGLHRRFDYLIPEHLRGQVQVGTIVRVRLQGRRVRGWVSALPDEPETDRSLLPVDRVSGMGPPPDVVELAEWAAWRWAGHPTHFLATASPPRTVSGLPPAPGADRPLREEAESPASALEALAQPVSVVRLPPAADSLPHVLAAAALGDTLVLAPSVAEASSVAAALRRAGADVALAPRDWARAAAGGCCVVGARAAAWAPVPKLAAVVVVDEHDEVYQEERTPTWNARDVVVERARRAGVPCLLLSPCPSLETLSRAPLVEPSRRQEREGWPVVEVVDRRREPPGLGLYSEALVRLVRRATPEAPVLCVLNRKGRARLLACASCAELARCEACEGPVESGGDRAGAGDEILRCRRCGATRPMVCRWCGTTRLKVLRVGVSRAREELEALAGQPVGEVTAEEADNRIAGAAVLIGTEAVLHRAAAAWAVAFLDFDQELMASRYRAAEQALALLVRAARLVGGRQRGRIVVQTRLPDHEVIDAALHADTSRLAVVEAARRAALRLPPETALARISGPAAPELVDRLRHQPELELLGPAAECWLVRAPDHHTLCEGLALAGRPPGRVRVEVDPLRA